MAFTKILVSNFKSFNNLEIRLGRFNVLVGANASGKSNVVSIFRFLRDVSRYGLDNAISMQGGLEYLRNMKVGKNEKTSFEICLDNKMTLLTNPEKDDVRVQVSDTTYFFALDYTSRRCKKLEDWVRFKCDFFQKTDSAEPAKCGEGEVTITCQDGTTKVRIEPRSGIIPLEEEDIVPKFIQNMKFPQNVLLINTPVATLLRSFDQALGEISIYDFDPKLAKKAAPVTGKIELEEDGNNLALVLKKITTSKKSKERFLSLLKDSLSFIDTVSVEKYADKSFLFNFGESYNNKKLIPASLISDGTITITAIILALYFGRKALFRSEEAPLTIIEEPERNIHPYLISKVVAMMKDVSEKKQVIITTHNPEVVRYADVEDVIFVFRDEEGFTSVSNPSESEEVQLFLREELGIDEIFKLNLLGV